MRLIDQLIMRRAEIAEIGVIKSAFTHRIVLLEIVVEQGIGKWKLDIGVVLVKISEIESIRLNLNLQVQRIVFRLREVDPGGSGLRLQIKAAKCQEEPKEYLLSFHKTECKNNKTKI